MAGYTDLALRRLCREYGSGFGMTEMVSAEALSRGSKRTIHYLETEASERPVGAHLYGAEPKALAASAAAVEQYGGYDFIDLNAGCPVPKIVKRGSGAVLMKDPARLETLVKAMVEATSLPVTVKTRTGLTTNTMNLLEVADAVQRGGAAALFVHARVASQQHAGPADWTWLKRVKAACSIPVIGNGAVNTRADVDRMFEETGVDGILVARAALGAPWVFAEIRDPTRAAPGPEDVYRVIERHLTDLIALKEKERLHRRGDRPAELLAALHFRPHLVRYLAGWPGWATVRPQLNTNLTKAEVLAATRQALGV